MNVGELIEELKKQDPREEVRAQIVEPSTGEILVGITDITEVRREMRAGRPVVMIG